MQKRKGQSTLEYVIILTAIIGAIILFSRQFKTNVSETLTHVGNEMQSAGSRIDLGGGN